MVIFNAVNVKTDTCYKYDLQHNQHNSTDSPAVLQT